MIKLLVAVTVALAPLASAGNAAQPCCCPDHEAASACEMSCGPVESPGELQAVLPGAAPLTIAADAIPRSLASLQALQLPQSLEPFTTPSDELPPKRYLRHRALRL